MSISDEKCKLWGTSKCIKRDNPIMKEAFTMIPQTRRTNPTEISRKEYSLKDALEVCRNCEADTRKEIL